MSRPTRESLARIWPEPPRKRQLPKKLRLALVGVGCLLAFIIGLGNRGTKLETRAPAPLSDDMVVSADELRNRREVRADDFRPRGPAARPQLSAAPTAPAATGTDERAGESLAERRARRGKDPEDVLTLRAKRDEKKSASAEAPSYDAPVYVTAPGARRDDSRGSTRSETPRGKLIAQAGASIPAVLTTPIELSGGTATVVARADGGSGDLRGARFVGSASSSAGRVTVRFNAALLADGRRARVDGEAQDPDGTFGLRVDSGPAQGGDDRGSVLGDVAEETATDVVSDAVGAGIAGRAVDRALMSSRSRRPARTTRTVTLPAGTKLQIFLHERLDVTE